MTQWWSTSDALGTGDNAWDRTLIYNNPNFVRFSSYKGHGFKIRCIRDVLPTVTTANITVITQNTATGGGNILKEGETALLYVVFAGV